jgi:hypothetical protein
MIFFVFQALFKIKNRVVQGDEIISATFKKVYIDLLEGVKLLKNIF